MGRRLTQTIYTCDKCGKTPKNGEKMWQMGTEIWCYDCCNEQEKELDNNTTIEDENSDR